MDKSVLLKRSAHNVEDVDIPGAGAVTVRGLTRAEVEDARVLAGGQKAASADMEIQLIAASLVDPEMTSQEVAEWLTDAPAGDSVAVMQAISRLSGLGQDARKSGPPPVRRPRKRS